MNLAKNLVIGAVLCAVCACSAANNAVLDQIRSQYIGYYAAKPADDDLITEWTGSMTAEGTWPDIDYQSQRRSGWDTRYHLRRLDAMAAARVNPKSGYHNDPELKDMILKGLQHWLDKDYQNPNWYNQKIGVPRETATAFLLMGEDLPDDMLQQALKTVLNRTEIEMTGQNRVWCSGIVLMRGLLQDDEDAVRAASEAIWEEVRVTTEEGIQADWTFHQHGPQLQVGNYGAAYGREMVKWASVLRGTPYALEGEKLTILRNLLLESTAWFYWKGLLDLSACGRQVMPGCQAEKGEGVAEIMKEMVAVDPKHAEHYDLDIYPRHGFKGFWRSDAAVARRPDWYASIRMSSTRTIGTESHNSENMRGLHLADGVLLHYRSGREYEDIQPLWDWRRLPGTTCDQGLKELKPPSGREREQSPLAGVVGDGTNGIAAMIYQRGKLTAHKAWFVFGDRIVCLGAGIRGDTAGPVYTSVEQRWLTSEVLSSAGPLPMGTHNIDAGGWVYHDGAGYRMHTGATVSTKFVKGTWKDIFPTRPEGDAEGELLAIWIDHGRSPDGASYAYTLFPNITASEMDRPAAAILSNTESIQAASLGGELSAVFYEPGKVSWEGRTVRVDKPCLLMIRNGKLYVADPLQKEKTITVSMGGKDLRIDLPSGQMAGSTVTIDAD